MRCHLPDHLPLGKGWQERRGSCRQQQVPMGTRDITSCRPGVSRASLQTPGGSQRLVTWGTASSAHERMQGSHPGLGGDAVGWVCSCEEPPCITHHHLPPRYRCPAVLLRWRAWPAGSPQEDGPGRLQQQEGSCITIQYNLSPFLLPSSRGDGYCLIPSDSSFIICLPPSSFPMVRPRLLCGRNQSLVSDGCSGGGREGTAE